MGLLRSEDMYLYKFVLSKDNAWDAIQTLGKTKSAHIIDMNRSEQPYKLPYTEMIKRCEETERRLMYLLSHSWCLDILLKSAKDTELDWSHLKLSIKLKCQLQLFQRTNAR